MSGKDFSDKTKDKQDRTSPFRNIHSITWLVAPALVLFDRLSKFAVVNYMHPGDSLPVVPPILYLTYVQNTGAAFGLFKGYAWMLLLVSVFVCIYLLLELGKRQCSSILYECSLCLILSGAVGNLIDRARFGYVVDFLDFRVWPVFNIADSSITIGVCLIIWQALRDRKRKDPI